MVTTRRLGDNARPSERFSNLQYLQLSWGQILELVIAVLEEGRRCDGLCRLVLLVLPEAVALYEVDSVVLGFGFVFGGDWN